MLSSKKKKKKLARVGHNGEKKFCFFCVRLVPRVVLLECKAKLLTVHYLQPINLNADYLLKHQQGVHIHAQQEPLMPLHSLQQELHEQHPKVG